MENNEGKAGATEMEASQSKYDAVIVVKLIVNELTHGVIACAPNHQ